VVSSLDIKGCFPLGLLPHLAVVEVEYDLAVSLLGERGGASFVSVSLRLRASSPDTPNSSSRFFAVIGGAGTTGVGTTAAGAEGTGVDATPGDGCDSRATSRSKQARRAASRFRSTQSRTVWGTSCAWAEAIPSQQSPATERVFRVKNIQAFLIG
jgi:hypothetical protein